MLLSALRRVRVLLLLGILLLTVSVACTSGETTTSTNRDNSAHNSSDARGSDGDSTETELSSPGESELTTRGSETTGPQSEESGEEAAQGSAVSVSESRLPLESKWYQDSDGNSAPDFIERELGYDPLVDDYASESNCPQLASSESAAELSLEQNTLLILASSGSMAETIGGQTKMDAAKAALKRYVTATPDFVNLGFEVYGQTGSNAQPDRAESCRSPELLEPLGETDYHTISGTLQTFEPTGWTPIESALDESDRAFKGREGEANRVILVSDGIETCGGDPAAAAQRLAESGIELQIDVVGFGIPGDQEQQLRDIAEVSGGTYQAVNSPAELNTLLSEDSRKKSELVSHYACFQRSRFAATGCIGNIQVDIFERLNALAAEGTTEEAAAIGEINSRVVDHYQNAYDRMMNQDTERIDQLAEDIREVERRMAQRYDENVSYWHTCAELSDKRA